MRYLYTLLLYVLIPFTLLRLLYKSRTNPDYRHRILERFGYRLPPAPKQSPLWIHTVSVGEFLALKPLLEHLIHTHPQLPLWLTCTTPTASAQIQQFIQPHPNLYHSYFPYDLPSIVKRHLSHINPRGIILMETELWPNLLTLAQRRALPIALINARLSAKSLRGYRTYLQRLLKPSLQSLQVNAQSKDDARRFRQLGIPAHHIRHTPNLKHHHPTSPPPAWLNALKKPLNSYTFIWLAASTHSGEDGIILDAHHQLQQHLPNSLLILAPRHPERRDSLIKLAQQTQYNPLLRSHNTHPQTPQDIWILDTLGELRHFYHLAHCAFIGGSLIQHGGHNPLEALHAGIPVCYGPSMYNFSTITAQLTAHPFAQTIHDATSLARTLQHYHQHPQHSAITQFNQQQPNLLKQHYQFIQQSFNL